MSSPGASLRLVFDVDGGDRRAARQCELDVFFQTYGNSAAEFEAEYGPYEEASRYMAVLNPAGAAVAACRLIVPGVAGLKTLNDLAREPWQVDGLRSARAARIDPARTWDIATIAVRRKGGVSGVAAAALYHGIRASCRANGIDWIVMIMDERARRLLTATGLTTYVLPGTSPGHYLGSRSSTPIYGDMSTMFEGQRRLNPDAYRMVAQGIGLDGIALPKFDEWHLRPRAGAGHGVA